MLSFDRARIKDELRTSLGETNSNLTTETIGIDSTLSALVICIGFARQVGLRPWR